MPGNVDESRCVTKREEESLSTSSVSTIMHPFEQNYRLLPLAAGTIKEAATTLTSKTMTTASSVTSNLSAMMYGNEDGNSNGQEYHHQPQSQQQNPIFSHQQHFYRFHQPNYRQQHYLVPEEAGRGTGSGTFSGLMDGGRFSHNPNYQRFGQSSADLLPWWPVQQQSPQSQQQQPTANQTENYSY